jgi:hypothetical protein
MVYSIALAACAVILPLSKAQNKRLQSTLKSIERNTEGAGFSSEVPQKRLFVDEGTVGLIREPRSTAVEPNREGKKCFILVHPIAVQVDILFRHAVHHNGGQGVGWPCCLIRGSAGRAAQHGVFLHRFSR